MDGVEGVGNDRISMGGDEKGEQEDREEDEEQIEARRKEREEKCKRDTCLQE